MSTKALIDRIAPYAKGWNRTGTKSILSLIEQAQDEMFDFDAPNMIYIDTDNEGFPPYLYTTSGTYKYEITAANLSVSALQKTIGGTARTVRCRRVIRIFEDATEFDYNNRWVGEPALYAYPNPYSTKTDRLTIAQTYVDSYPALENTAAYIQFKEDPGTHGSGDPRYFCEFAWEPPRLVGENIPLIVPQRYEKALQRYVIGEIQMLENGKLNEFQSDFERLKIEFQQTVAAEYAVADNEQVRPLSC